MRADSASFAVANAAAEKSPRFVVGILFDVGSLYFTSHGDISGVPGTVFNGVLEGNSALSQRLAPEQGRAEIGSLDFNVVDISGALTSALRAKLVDLEGLRGRTVKLWHGFEGLAFSGLQLFQTQEITSVDVDGSVYRFICQDITRQQRKEIFAPRSTTLRLSCTNTDSTIYVADPSEFVPIYHGAAYTDAPNLTVGYFKIEDEIVRYTGKTSDAFTGCTRGALGTTAKAHAVDTNTSLERRAKIDEVIFLEGPAVEIAYAINTGVIYGTAYTLPDHWHLGIATASLRTADWTDIGADLWDPTDRTKGVQLSFLRPKKQDGKSFIETQLMLLLGCCSPVYSDGTLGLKRTEAIIAGAAPVATLTTANVVRVGAMAYDMKAMRNRFRIQWSWDGDAYRRESEWRDENSSAVHQESEWMELAFTGLVGRRHTDVTIRQRLSQLADRFSAPPWRLSLTVLGGLNRIEVGDVVRVAIQNLKDFAGSSVDIDRSFEVQQVSVNYETGDVELELFGSTSKQTETPLELSGVPALPDAYYTQVGTALSSVMTIDGSGVVSGGPYTLTGGTDLNDSGSIWYHAGDLTIPDSVTVNIANNVRLRVRGFLQVNGEIDGVGAGPLSGVADSNNPTVFPDGSPGFVGNSRGRDGMDIGQESGNPKMLTIPAKMVAARYPVFPYHAIEVAGSQIVGLPNYLHGTGGAPGGKVTYQGSTQRAAGGTGGNGGAGLMIECRGLGFGVSGEINLSGTDGQAGTRWDTEGKGWNPGAGGGGGPGSLMVILDGSTVTLPDFAGKFFAVCGAVPTAAPYDGKLKYLEQPGEQRYSLEDRNYAGFDDPAVISGADLSDACLRVQYVPYPIAPEDITDDPPPPPTDLSATAGPGYILLRFTPPEVPNVTTEIWSSPDSSLGNATLAGEASGTQFYHALLDSAQRFYFFRTKKVIDENSVTYSGFVPDAPSTVTSIPQGVVSEDTPEGDDFLERFEYASQSAVLDAYDSVYGSGSITIVSGAGSFGGKVLQVAGGSRAFISRTNIPIDPSGLYRMTARVRQTVTPTNGTNDRTWIGFRGVAADGSTTVLTPGGLDHYVTAASLDLGGVATGTWSTVSGYFTGSTGTTLSPAPSVDNPSRVASGVVYIRPIIWANYLDGDGTQQFDYVQIEKLIAGRWVDILGDGKPSDYADNTFDEMPRVNGVFLDNFEHQAFDRHYSHPVPGFSEEDVEISYPASGINSGRVLRISGQALRHFNQLIPFDPDAVYKLTIRVRQIAYGSAGSTPIIIGYAGVAADGVTYINRVGDNSYGTQHEQLNFFGTNYFTLGDWNVFSAWFGGHGTPVAGTRSPDDPMALYPGVAYFKPVLEFNRNSTSGGIMEVDFIRIDRMIEPWAIVPGSALLIYQASTSSVDVYNSGSTSTQAVSVSVPSQSGETEQVVTVVGNVDHNAASGSQGSTYALIVDSFTSSQGYGTEDTIARNQSTALLRTVQSFVLERKYTVPANTEKTYSLSALGMGVSAPGSSCLLKAVTMTVKVHRA